MTTPQRCDACGHGNPAGYRFCEECGEVLRAAEQAPATTAATPAVCPSCGHPNLAGYRFCEECGEVLPPAGEAAVASPAVPGPEPLVEAPVEEPLDEMPFVCPSCGHPAPAGYRFCEECGEVLATAEAAPLPTPALESGPPPEQAKPPAPVETALPFADASPPEPQTPAAEMPAAVEPAEAITAGHGIICMACGAANRTSVRFCEECGALLVAPKRAPAAARPTHQAATTPPIPPVAPAAVPLPVPEGAAPLRADAHAVIACTACGHANPPSYTFCEECGAPLLAAVPGNVAAPTGPRPGAPPAVLQRLPTRRRRRLRLAAAALLMVVAATAGVLWWLLRGGDPLAGNSPESATRVADAVVEHLYPEYRDASRRVDQIAAPDGHIVFEVSYSTSTDAGFPVPYPRELTVTVDPTTSEVFVAESA